MIPLTLLFLAQKRNLLIPLELSGVMHQGNEFSGRHNVRTFDTIDQMAAMVQGMDGKRLRYKDLIENLGAN